MTCTLGCFSINISWPELFLCRTDTSSSECVYIEVDQYVEMKKNNAIAPYGFKRVFFSRNQCQILKCSSAHIQSRMVWLTHMLIAFGLIQYDCFGYRIVVHVNRIATVDRKRNSLCSHWSSVAPTLAFLKCVSCSEPPHCL